MSWCAIAPCIFPASLQFPACCRPTALLLKAAPLPCCLAAQAGGLCAASEPTPPIHSQGLSCHPLLPTSDSASGCVPFLFCFVLFKQSDHSVSAPGNDSLALFSQGCMKRPRSDRSIPSCRASCLALQNHLSLVMCCNDQLPALL